MQRNSRDPRTAGVVGSRIALLDSAAAAAGLSPSDRLSAFLALPLAEQTAMWRDLAERLEHERSGP